MKTFKAFNDLPIKDKLVLLCTFTTALALVLASAVFITTELVSMRRSMVNDLTGVAETLGSNVKSALIFRDNKSAREVLDTLKAIPSIQCAVLYDGNGAIFTTYWRNSITFSHHAVLPRNHMYHFGMRHLDLYRQIQFDGETVGTLYIRSDMTHFYSRMARYALIFFAVMGVSLLMSYLLLTKLQAAVTRPIFELAALMRTISRDKDYSVRARIHGKDEIGLLAEGFNQMVTNIETRDAELRSYRKNLEELVYERTAQLTTTNTQLQKELAERLRAENALVESEYRYRTIFETTGNANLILDENGMIAMVNTAFEHLSGYKRGEIEGIMTWMEFCPADMLEEVTHYRELRKSSPDVAPKGYEARFMDRDKMTHDVYVSAAVVPGSTLTVASFLDLTELKRLEAQLRQSQKIEAIGQLAGGVAHDFNNILTAIIGYASLLRMKMGDDHPTKAYIDPILASAERATHLTQGLLAFSRKQVMAPKAVDLNDAIRKVERLLVRLMGEDIELKTSYDTRNVTVFADPGQIEQILMNLATNARDSMADGGSFSIATEQVTLDSIACEALGFGKPGMYACITVSDSGKGMDKETMEHIFEPFFTTKEVGRGTGLGLSIVYGIVKQHNGYINARSEPGLGTGFEIYLPLIRPLEEEETAQKPRRIVGGSETLLLAEDDAHSRALIREVLEKFGYTVVEAIDGDDAIEKFINGVDLVSLVILDVIMPKKNGRIVYERIKEIRPEVKALFISGYTADIIHRRGIYEEDIHFLTKPIMPDDLAAKIRDILDSKG